MKSYVVCVSDAAHADCQTPVTVEDETSLGRVAQIALDEFIATCGSDVAFPLFVDIHPVEQFASVRWMQPRPS
jgi:hypothetical protein